MALLGFLFKNWRIALVVIFFLAFAGAVIVLGGELRRLSDELVESERREAAAVSSLTTERANVDDLVERLADAKEEARVEREAREAAENARKDALEAAADRATERQTIIIEEREHDPDLAACLDYELPDNIVRQLPFGASAPRPDNR